MMMLNDAKLSLIDWICHAMLAIIISLGHFGYHSHLMAEELPFSCVGTWFGPVIWIVALCAAQPKRHVNDVTLQVDMVACHVTMPAC